MTGIRGKVLGAFAAAAIVAIALPASAAAVPDTDTCRAQDDQVLADADIKTAERSLLCLVNVHRVDKGVPPLPWDTNLAAAAREHSEDMVARQFYDHINPDGEDATDRAKRHHYPGKVGENILWRPLASGVSPEQFFLAWEGAPASEGKGPTNDENMLSPFYKAIGLGFALGTPEKGTEGATATQVFGLKSTTANYTGLDMLIPAECPPARKALKKAEAKLAAAKDAGVGVGVAKRKVKKRKAAVRRTCNPTRF